MFIRNSKSPTMKTKHKREKLNKTIFPHKKRDILASHSKGSNESPPSTHHTRQDNEDEMDGKSHVTLFFKCKI